MVRRSETEVASKDLYKRFPEISEIYIFLYFCKNMLFSKIIELILFFPILFPNFDIFGSLIIHTSFFSSVCMSSDLLFQLEIQRGYSV